MIEIESLAQELATITPDALKVADNNIIKDHAPNFRLFFRQLGRLLGENVPNANQFTSNTEQLAFQGGLLDTSDIQSIPYSTINTKKRPNSLTITTFSPTKVRPKSFPPEQDIPHTPDQPTVPKNPDDTGDSVESIDEDNTKQMMKVFIDTLFDLLEPEFGHVSWPLYAKRCQLDISGYYRFLSVSYLQARTIEILLGQKAGGYH